jgi:dihydrodipicolinate synthase/N-acetylneuraminate lyase
MSGTAVLRGHSVPAVTCVVWTGFASEFYKLSDNERILLRRCMLEHVRSKAGTWAVISVTQHATRLALEDAVAAAEAGAHAVNLLPPYFLSPSRDAVLEHLKAVLSVVAPLPIIVQYAPSLAPAPIDSADLTNLAAEHPNLRMVKVDSAPAGPTMTALRDGQPPLRSMVGYAGVTMIDSLRHGACGVQPGCRFVEIYQRIWQMWEEGRAEEAATLHHRILPYLASWMQDIELIIQVEKNISKQRGWIRSDYCRAPRRKLTIEDRATISRFLDEFAGLLDNVCENDS